MEQNPKPQTANGGIPWWLGLRTRLTIGFCLGFLAVLALVQLVGVFGVPFTNFSGRIGEQRNKALYELALIANGKRDFLLFWLNERRAAVNFIAANDFVEANALSLRERLAALPETPDLWPILRQEPDSLSLVEFFDKIRAAYGFYRAIQIADAETGVVFVATDPDRLGRNVSQSAGFKGALAAQGGYVSDMERAVETGTPCFSFTDVVKDQQGVARAVLMLEVDADVALSPLLATEAGLGDRGEMLLVNRRAEVLTPLKHPLPDGSRARPLEYRIQATPALLAARGEDGVIETLDYRDVPVLAAYRGLEVAPDWSWGMVVKIDRDELAAPLYRDLQATALRGLAGVLVAILVTNLMAGRIIRPILALGRVARQLAAGDRSVRCAMVRNDEIGSLSNVFNRMAETVETTMSGLEQQAAELQAITAELEMRQRIQQQALAVSAGLAAAGSLAELLDEGLRQLMLATRAQVGAIYLHDKEGSFRLARAIGEAPDAPLAKRIEPGAGGLGHAAASRQIEILADIPPETRYHIRTVVGESLPNGVVHVPLVLQDRTVGVLALASLYPIRPEQLEVAELVRAQMATAIINAQAHAETERLARDLQATNEELACLNEELQSQAEELQGQSEELQAQTAELIAQQSRVEEADKLKSEFLSNMSHELRTPLNSIMALSQLMISRGPGKDTEQETEFLKVIERNGRQLLNLINDILDLSKIEAGRIDLFVSEFAPRSVVERAISTISPLATEKGLSIKSRFAGIASMVADEDKVYQILLNLLSNAVKFTDRGEIEVTVAPAGLWGVGFAVRDTGIGIVESDLAAIFDEFRQVDGSTTRRHEGTGLGLAICRKLARLLGGEIEVQSEPGRGSVFTLVLPIQYQGSVSGSEPKRTKKPDHLAPVQSGKTVEDEPVVLGKKRDHPLLLVVEDNPVAVMQIQSVLEDAGYIVRTAANGEEGLRLARNEIPDGIVLDLMMPGVDGFEVLEQIRSTTATATLPVLILTAKELTSADRARLSHNHIQQLVQKGSLDRKHLLECVDKMLRETREPSLRQLKTADCSVPVLDHDHPQILVVEDYPDNRLTLEALLKELGCSFTTVSDGIQAIQAVREHRPALVLMDINLPLLSGLDATRKLKSDPELRDIPVIALTARAMKGDRENFLAAGCDGYLSKPIEPSALYQLLEQWLPELVKTNPENRE
jgi:signal transduction histidine kinase/DNA-binding response OmpR family regulator/HAMP domain-containing protein